MKRTPTQRFSAILFVIGVLVFQAGMLFTPRVAHAQLVVANPDLIAQNIQQQVAEQVFDKIESSLVSAIGSQLVNLILYSVNQVATESAIWVASGGQGDRPLFSTNPAENFLQYAGASIVAEVYNQVDYEVLQRNGGVMPGSNIRLSDDPEYLVGVREGLKSAYVRPEDSFDFTEISDNYQGYLVSVYASDATPQQKTEAILATMSHSFRSNEFSNGMQVFADTVIDAQVKAQVQTDQVVQNDGFLPQTRPGSNQVDLPASFVAQDLFASLQRPQILAQELSTSLLTGSDNLLLGVGQYAGTIFTNTLISELMDKFRNGLFEDVAPTFSTNRFDPNASDPFARERAQDLFRSISAFQPLEVRDYNLVSQLSSCAAGTLRNSRALYSCAMNTSFASAVSRAESGTPLTILEAIDEGYLDASWPLIPSSDVSSNQDTNCRNYGFCHSNLLKMRKARLISVGWEIAAELGGTQSSPFSLQEALDGFYDCNTDGERDAEHPLCHLIDPNWVLKAPESSCRTLAYGQLLTASGTESRAEECVDIQTCVEEGDDGTCVGGYGYCTREKNVWRFRGDICPEQYASCLSFETREGEMVNYLRNTVDFAACDEEATGCLWYATQKRLTPTGGFDWPVVNDVALADASPDAYKNRLYFNANVEACDPEEGGCSDVLVRGNDLKTTLNLIQNASFEADADEDARPDVWLSDAYGAFVVSADNSSDRSGATAVAPGTGLLRQFGVVLNQNRFYSFSFYARQPDAAGSGSVTGEVRLFDEFGEENVEMLGYSFDGVGCSQLDVNGDGTRETIQVVGTPTGTGYERFSCVFTAPPLSNPSANLDVIVRFLPTSVLIDDVVLEQTGDPGAFHADYGSTSLTKQTIKIAPDYLGCTGAATDPAACADYAQVCSPNDVGCQIYTPTNGDPAITGVVSELDVCPSVCVGYDTFKQEPTPYEPNGEFPLYFIPSSADVCSAEAVGCDEFTNLQTEAREYYTYLRSCVTQVQADSNTSGDEAATYYTWEGSDEEGFQLREWRLLESNLDAPGYANYGYDTNGDGLEDAFETDPGSAPCTHGATDADGIGCSDDLNGDLLIDSSTTACDSHDDVISNPDCREFYDTDGDIHYRPWSKTISVDDACVSYRKTTLAGLGDDADVNGTDDGEENCFAAGGFFDAAVNQCRFYGLTEESVLCDESENGCRRFTGGRSNNSRVAFEDVFESGTLANWNAGNASLVTLSNDSIATDGHSLRSDGLDIWTHVYDNGGECTNPAGCASGTGVLGGTCTVREGETHCGTLANDIFVGKTYTLSFWAKGSGSVRAGFDVGFSGSSNIDAAFGDAVTLSPLWQQYSVGPIDLNARNFAGVGDDTVLVFENTSGQTYWIDNVTLREGEENMTLIKDSWVTPATCDVNLEGQPSPQYHLGCAAYTSGTGATAYLKSFRRLCSEDQIGCSAYFRTYESDAPNGQVLNATCTNPSDANGDGEPETVLARTACHLFNNGAGGMDTNSPVVCQIGVNENSCTFDLNFFLPETRLVDVGRFTHIEYTAETTIVPADTDYYAIVRSDDVCAGGSAGCTELGAPTFSSDRSSVQTWETVHLVNDPDKYNEILCSSEELFCEAYDAGTEGTFYFKDPQNSLCEYKTNVNVAGTAYDGWFVTGTSEFCYGTGTCSDDASACTTNTDCRANTGTCSDSGDVCSQDFDCGQGEFCEGVSAATCTITDPSHLVGGDFSGIWRNGDAAYAGQVGMCTAEADTCTEFLDPLDYDDDRLYSEDGGESYFFLNNDRLGEDSLLSSSRCNGEVSQEQGCVLFNDTGEPGQTSNSSATYVSSRHADDLYGENPFSLVPPIDCNNGESASVIVKPDGTTVDLCASRCTYDKGYMNEITDGDPAFVKMLGGERDENELYVFGESCYVDTDCAPKENDLGELIDGTCNAVVPIEVDFSNNPIQTAPVPRLSNDTNEVLKVSRDRICSEWLACSSSFTVWNPDLGKYQEVCDTIDLCTKTGEGENCVEWDSEDPAVVLDIARYTDRDVSWYGEEFSGYSIPDTFPIQHLEQVNVEPVGLCGSSNPAIGVLAGADACRTDADCSGSNVCITNTETDFRLAYNAGTCDEAQGESCTVGFCSDDGSSCSADSECESGACSVGSCLDLSAESCSLDADCSGGDICVGGFCATDTGDACGLDFACGAGETCVTSTATRAGSCMRDNCLLAADGTPFDTAAHETAVCRAQPEQNSPFGNEVVEEWAYTNGGTIVKNEEESGSIFVSGTRSAALPFDTLSGFEEAALCAPGEACECSYKKVSASTGQTAYVSSRTDLGDLGLCLGGEMDGAFCSEDADCGPALGGAGSSAMCVPITREDTLIGLEGYCLERDTGLNINGDPTLGACLTWLPVDQLAGSTDLFAKYTSAGVNEDVYFCAVANTYNNVTAFRGCSAIRGEDGLNGDDSVTGSRDENSKWCRWTATCPDGYFALTGRAQVDAGTTGREAQLCLNGGSVDFETDLWGGAVDACPFMCVPKNSFHEDGSSCEAPTSATSTGETAYSNTDFWYYNGYTEYNTKVDEYDDCTAYGVWAESSSYDLNAYPNNDDLNGTGGIDYMAQTTAYQVQESYPGCRNILQAASSELEDYNVAYTDRMLNPNSGFAVDAGEFTYDIGTEPLSFGRTLSPTLDIDDNYFGIPDPTPRVVPSCTDSTESDAYTPILALDGSCEPSDVPVEFGNDGGTRVEAREWIDWTRGFPLAPSLETSDTTLDVANRIKLLFALPVRMFGWTTEEGNLQIGGEGLGSYGGVTEEENFAGSFDSFIWDERSAGTPPTVWSIDPDNCFGTSCREGAANQITVNNQNTGAIEAESFLRATVKFFAGADKNQLPLRRVIVNWGDEDTGGTYSGSDDSENFYQNHRGILPESQTESWCDTDDEWGMTTESCDDNFFNYSHNYFCSNSLLLQLSACTDGDGDGNVDESPCSGLNSEGVTSCAFRPSVHVRDNWGWCSGTCDIAGPVDVDNSSGCFEGNIDTLLNPGSNQSECSYLEYPDFGGDSVDPWVYYNGTIYVTP